MPEASSFERAYNNINLKSDIYIVGASTNLNLIPDLKYTQEINFIRYNMATEIELGHYYKYFDFETDYYSNFLFIGKNNKVIGKLDYSATQEELENMFNLTLASFEGIHKRKLIENTILTGETVSFDLSDYIYIEDGKSAQFSISGNSNPLAVTGNIGNGKLNLIKGEYTGSSKMTVQVKVPEKEIYFNMDFYVFSALGESEDFEYDLLTESNLPWDNDREEWIIAEDFSFTGNYSIRSGDIVDKLSTTLSLTINLENPDFISFAYRTSSEVGGDTLSFHVDNTLMNFSDPVSLWSGYNDWRVVTYNLRPGEHILKWTYSKNDFGSVGDDCVWLDAVVLPVNSVVGSGIENDKLPSSLDISNYPNPFNPDTTIDFSLNRASNVILSIYDMNGQIVEKIHEGFTQAGNYSHNFNGDNISSGIYYAVIKTENQQKVSKMILVK
ncbi:MAG: T9SS type A sorting domain-containing protein [Candidatus Delongbacteria bacterium]|nr:T9SS type A sorting domain-containing protein [Candidatus Delongbacteria bacterium]